MHLFFLASNWHADILQTIVKSMESKHCGIANIVGGSFASLAGKTNFEKRILKKSIPNMHISFSFNEIIKCARLIKTGRVYRILALSWP